MRLSQVLRGPEQESLIELGRHDQWYTRASKGYSGKGARPSRFEHHAVTVTTAGVRVEVVIAFENCGVHRSFVTSDGVASRGVFDAAHGTVPLTPC